MIFIILILLLCCGYMYYHFTLKINGIRKQNITLIMQNKELIIKVNKTKSELKNAQAQAKKNTCYNLIAGGKKTNDQ